MSAFMLDSPPTQYCRLGCIMPRGKPGSIDAHVTGDPCVVWDAAAGAHRMFYFAQGGDDSAPACCNAEALLRPVGDTVRVEKLGPVIYANPGELLGLAHKPWIVMDPRSPGVAAKPDGRYWLLMASHNGPHKVVQRARAESLAGPWELDPAPLVDVGPAGDFDDYHADSPTGWWFPERRQVLVLYKGYPRQPQADQPASPFGSSLAAATLAPGDSTAKKLGKLLSPLGEPRHTAGWIGPMQLFAAKAGGWFGLFNASPTPPAPVEDSPWMREPAPSQAQWAYTSDAFPVSGWQVISEPIVSAADVPADATADGEGVNFWRHHLARLHDGRLLLLYNSGAYGQERLYARWAV